MWLMLQAHRHVHPTCVCVGHRMHYVWSGMVLSGAYLFPSTPIPWRCSGMTVHTGCTWTLWDRPRSAYVTMKQTTSNQAPTSSVLYRSTASDQDHPPRHVLLKSTDGDRKIPQRLVRLSHNAHARHTYTITHTTFAEKQRPKRRQLRTYMMTSCTTTKFLLVNSLNQLVFSSVQASVINKNVRLTWSACWNGFSLIIVQVVLGLLRNHLSLKLRSIPVYRRTFWGQFMLYVA